MPAKAGIQESQRKACGGCLDPRFRGDDSSGASIKEQRALGTVLSIRVYKNVSGRMPYLDGLRGIAIAMVLLFHAYARWPNLYAYRGEFVSYKWLNTGTAGVHLFFLISGFVILMSLEKAETFSSFLYRRWIRLFPAMLVCTIFIVSTAPFFANRPNGDIGSFDWLPGLTLMGDDVWRSLLGPDVKDIEGAFWSLYVEVYFYVIFGLSFFLMGRRRALYVLLVLYSLFRALKFCESPWIIEHNPADIAGFARVCDDLYITKILAIIKAENYSWFIEGALFYLYSERRDVRLFVCAVALSVFHIVSTDHAIVFANLFVVALFSACLVCSRVRGLVQGRVLLFLGFVSYPLYLLHENMMVSLIVSLGRYDERIPAVIAPIAPILFVVCLGWIVARYIEPRAKLGVVALLSAVGLKRDVAQRVEHATQADPT